MNEWKCQKCGACCEVLPLLVYGKQCDYYDKQTRLCKIYNSRPDVCRAKHLLGDAITELCCEFLRVIRR